MFKIRHLFSLSLAFISIALVFQNCGEGFQTQSVRKSVSLDVGGDHYHTYGSQFKTGTQTMYMNRVQMTNVFASVFGNEIKQDLIERIGWASAEFGSAFGVYNKKVLSAAACNNNRNIHYRCNNMALNYRAVNISGASAPREGRRSVACHIGVENNSALEHAFKKIQSNASLNSPPEVSDENFKKAFQLFFRGKPYPGPGFSDALNITFAKNNDTTEAWKTVILSLCLSPHWQVL